MKKNIIIITSKSAIVRKVDEYKCNRTKQQITYIDDGVVAKMNDVKVIIER